MKKYIVDTMHVEEHKSMAIIPIIGGILLIPCTFLWFAHSNADPLSRDSFIWYGIWLLFSVSGVLEYIRTNKRLKIIDDLCENGTLIKNLPYSIKVKDIAAESSSHTIEVFWIVVDYTTKDGKVLHLKSDVHYTGRRGDSDGFVDLLIDENHPKHYFIDFNIGCAPGVTPSYDAQESQNNTFNY